MHLIRTFHINHACVTLYCTQASLQEVYEAKLRLLDEEVRLLQQQVLRLQKENANQKELNNNVQRAMTDMKTKYDSSATSWAKARKDMQDKLESVMSVCCLSVCLLYLYLTSQYTCFARRNYSKKFYVFQKRKILCMKLECCKFISIYNHYNCGKHVLTITLSYFFN